ncbi:MAG: hypothetical protein ACKO5Q_00815, partial [Microcystaceae cyanobacterium]
ALRFVALIREDDGRITIFELKEDLGTSVDQFKQQIQDNLLRTLDDYIYSLSLPSNLNSMERKVRFIGKTNDYTFHEDIRHNSVWLRAGDDLKAVRRLVKGVSLGHCWRDQYCGGLGKFCHH